MRTRWLAAWAALWVSLGCANVQAAELRFTIWSGSQQHLDLLNGIAAAYRRDHPDVSVRFDVIPFGDYVQKVTLQLAGGNPPDLGWLQETAAPTFIEAGVLADVGRVLRADAAYRFDDFSGPAMGLWVRGDSVYGVPFSTSPFLVFFNRDMFKAAGLTAPDELAARGAWNWEALRKAAGTLAKGLPRGVYGFESVDGQGYDVRIWHTLIPIIWAYGGDAWSGTRCTLDSPQAVQAVRLYHDMIFKDRSVVPPGEQGDFFSGRAAMTITQLSRVSKLEGAKFSWGLSPVPGGPAGNVSVIGQAAIVVFARSKNAAVAADFLRFLTSQDSVARMAQFFPPARVSVLESEAFLKANPQVSAEQMWIVRDGIRTGRVLPGHARFPQIDAASRPVFDKLWRADAGVEAVMEEVCTAIDPLLK